MVQFAPFAFTRLLSLLSIAVLGSGAGIPLGVPPRDPDPIMVKIAPEQCLYFTTCVGMAEADPDSGNQTEQLLSEPQVKAFVQEVDRAVQAALTKMSANVPGEIAVAMGNAPLLLKTLLTHPVTLFVESVTPRGDSVDVQGALVVNLGDEADPVMRAITQFLGTAPPNVASKVTIGGVECVQIRTDPDTPIFTIGHHEDYLIVAAGEGSFEGVLRRAATPPPRWLTDGIETLKVPRHSTFSYANVKAVSELAGGLGGPDVQRILDTLGLTSLETAISVSGLDETGFVSRAKIISSDPSKGLGAFVSNKPLLAADLAGLPADATLAAAVRFDVQSAVAEALQLLDEIEPRAAAQIRDGLDQLARPLGLDIQKDLLGALGDVWTLHTAPSGGGLLAGWTVTVNLKDAPRAGAVNQKLLQFAKAVFAADRGAPTIREFQHAGLTAYTMEVPDDDVFVAPSWCLTDTHLVVTLLPQTLKSFLSGVKAERSFADLPAVAELLAVENGPCAIAYQDVRSQFVTFYPFVQYAVQFFARQMQREEFDIDTTALPSVDAIAPHLLPSVMAARKVDDGFESYVHSTLPGANLGASAPVMVALLLPAVQASREASRRMQSMNNLRQIALAMHNYHDTYKAFPAAYSADKEGKPLLSWRVHILPYIEAGDLYDQFHLDESWDSEHNRKLIARMPVCYLSPNSTADPGKTVYLGNAGQNGIFVAPKKNDNERASAASGTRMAEIRDGTSNTIMAVEVNDTAAVIWTKPDDLEFDEKNPLRGLAGARPGGFQAALCDGSVRFIAQAVDQNVLKALFTKDGGEPIGGF